MRHLALTTAIVLTLALAALARADTVDDAVALVEEFASRRDGLVKEMNFSSEATRFVRERAAATEKTTTELKTLRWTEEPGKRRTSRITRAVEGYLDDEIEALGDLRERLPGREGDVDDILSELSSLRERILQELAESFKKEAERMEKGAPKPPRPVPSVDTSPFETKPEMEKGIYER